MNENDARELFTSRSAELSVGPVPELRLPNRSVTRSRLTIVGGALAVLMVLVGAGLALNFLRPSDEPPPMSPSTDARAEASTSDTVPECDGTRSVETIYETWGVDEFTTTPEQVPRRYLAPGETLELISSSREDVDYRIVRADASTRAIVGVGHVPDEGWYLAAAATCVDDPMHDETLR